MNKKIWNFITWEATFLALLFAVGLFFLAPNTTVVDQTFVSIGGYFLELAIKTVLAIAITLTQSFIFLRYCLDIRVLRLKDRFQASNNDSHAFLIIGIAASVVTALFSVKGANLHQYLYNLCIKMPIGYLVSVVITIVVSRLFGVKNIERFRAWIDTKDNDSYAILVAGILVLSMILAMSV